MKPQQTVIGTNGTTVDIMVYKPSCISRSKSKVSEEMESQRRGKNEETKEAECKDCLHPLPAFA